MQSRKHNVIDQNHLSLFRLQRQSQVNYADNICNAAETQQLTVICEIYCIFFSEQNTLYLIFNILIISVINTQCYAAELFT